MHLTNIMVYFFTTIIIEMPLNENKKLSLYILFYYEILRAFYSSREAIYQTDIDRIKNKVNLIISSFSLY